MKAYRHGENLLLKINKIPKNAKELETKIFATGSSNNNHSVTTGKLFKKENLSQIKKSFCNWEHNKLKLVFPNGNWISTIWGSGSYTENHDFQTDSIEDKYGYETFMDSNDVEIMVNCGEKLSKKIHKKYNGDGSVIGRLNITQWLEILKLLEKEKKSN